MEKVLVLLTTVGSADQARALADCLLNERAAACVSIAPGIESHYTWKGKRERSDECLLLIKTDESHLNEARNIILQQHPYECPELLVLESECANVSYFNWLVGVLRSES